MESFYLLDAVFAQNCGQSRASRQPIASYIVGGLEANPGDYPWQVGLIESGYLICGGTYVNGNAAGSVKVVTAAHCLSGKNPNPNNYRVVFGMHITTDSTGRVIAQVTGVSKHEQYNSNTFSNDIAVLDFTIGSSDLSSTFASPACLPSRSYYSGEAVVVSGWGTTSEGGSSSSVLRYVWKQMISLAECETTGNAGNLDQSMLCAGEAGKDACQGDSGGPLVAARSGCWELVGVVSWGFGCGRDNYPGVYADAFHLKNWTLSKI
ncbi:Trypsin-like serine protease [Mactra antiquata]